jgi:SAM-dependent methyltransferase
MTTARDGSPVELYARMPTFGEPELVHGVIPAGAEILELGCGAGRMTHRLLELGHPVTAVDNSAEMLARVRGATTVEAEIEDLDLGRRFGCVLLASQLINVGDDERAAFLSTCARHVSPDGVVLIQRYDPVWAADPTPSVTEKGGVRIRVLEPRREGGTLRATVEYEVDGRTWRHGPFTSHILDEAELEAQLMEHGLRMDRWLDDRATWLAAVPVAR